MLFMPAAFCSHGVRHPPQVLADIAEGVRVIDEEQFGPIIPVMKYKTVEEAVERANDTDFGLGASVWGPDANAANDVALKVQSGSVWVNDHLASHESAPFGGIKQSGIGNEGGGTIGLKEFVDMKTMKMAKNQ
jgi:acyl-CoA reductase-like NAD-dependent aldehyde dehydrogenase